MKVRITHRARRLTPALVAVVAGISLSAAPALIAPATAGALPIQAKGCRPGQIKTSGGKKYVCDKNGHWIRVVSIAVGGVGTLGGVEVVGTLPSGTLTSTATSGLKAMEVNNGGGATVTCGLDSKPGDYMEHRSYIYVNGRRTGFTTITFICGEDGNWHQVAELVSQTGIVAATGILIVQGVRP
jgi:hypothetical protein